MLGFSSRANWRNCCTARCWSIWYRLFIATLSFSWQKKPPSAHYDRGCESRYFLRINGHPHVNNRPNSFRADALASAPAPQSIDSASANSTTEEVRRPIAKAERDGE